MVVAGVRVKEARTNVDERYKGTRLNDYDSPPEANVETTKLDHKDHPRHV